MSIHPEFKQFRLSDFWPHPSGKEIPFRFERGEVESVFLWGLEPGDSFSPEIHPHGHVLKIEAGSGVISVDGREIPYSVGDEFDIRGNVPHGFVRVDKATVVRQMPA